ncbi:hypothetical protein B0919_01895 [Hymenobacter sp. CRA2]|nr:hypothetical protein B0919_01895 [Hymenobacter sp. CRA2]
MPGELLPLSIDAGKQVLLRTWLITFWLPALLIWVLQRLGCISSVELYERRQRPLPLLIAAMAFGGAALHVGQLYQASSLAIMLAGVGLSVLLTLIISFFWKISAHGMGMGGAIGLFGALLLHARLPLAQAWLWLLLAVLLAAAVGWARLRLQAHTPAQVLAGLALGTGVSVFVCLYAWPAVVS